jgi:hypothetical protein
MTTQVAPLPRTHSTYCAAARDPQEMRCPQIQTVKQHSCKEYKSLMAEQNKPNRTPIMGS